MRFRSDLLAAASGLAAGRGVERLHRGVLDRLGRHGLLDWSRAAVDNVSVRAKRKGELTGPSPTDRGKAGTKYHVLCDRNGLPLHAVISEANAHDSTLLAALLDTNPGVRERRDRPGRPRRRPEKLHADKGYDYRRCRRCLHGAGSQRGSPAAVSRTPAGWAGCAASWNERWRGCWVTVSRAALRPHPGHARLASPGTSTLRLTTGSTSRNTISISKIFVFAVTTRPDMPRCCHHRSTPHDRPAMHRLSAGGEHPGGIACTNGRRPR